MRKGSGTEPGALVVPISVVVWLLVGPAFLGRRLRLFGESAGRFPERYMTFGKSRIAGQIWPGIELTSVDSDLDCLIPIRGVHTRGSCRAEVRWLLRRRR